MERGNDLRRQNFGSAENLNTDDRTVTAMRHGNPGRHLFRSMNRSLRDEQIKKILRRIVVRLFCLMDQRRRLPSPVSSL